MKLSGYWWATVFSGGKIKQQVEGHNVITTDGLSFVAGYLADNCIASSTSFTMQYIGVGTDSTAESAANTALGTELARVTGVVSSATGAIYRVTATFPSGTGTGAIVEYGLFSSSSAGTMLSRDTEAVVNKGANDELVVVTEITLS
jgi:hypothetical protein